MHLEYGVLNWFHSLVQMLDRQEKILSKLWYSTETFFKINNHNFYLNTARIKANTAYGAMYIFNNVKNMPIKVHNKLL